MHAFQNRMQSDMRALSRSPGPLQAINFFSFDTYLRALTEADILGPNVSRFAAGAMAGTCNRECVTTWTNESLWLG